MPSEIERQLPKMSELDLKSVPSFEEEYEEDDDWQPLPLSEILTTPPMEIITGDMVKRKEVHNGKETYTRTFVRSKSFWINEKALFHFSDVFMPGPKVHNHGTLEFQDISSDIFPLLYEFIITGNYKNPNQLAPPQHSYLADKSTCQKKDRPGNTNGNNDANASSNDTAVVNNEQGGAVVQISEPPPGHLAVLDGHDDIQDSPGNQPVPHLGGTDTAQNSDENGGEIGDQLHLDTDNAEVKTNKGHHYVPFSMHSACRHWEHYQKTTLELATQNNKNRRKTRMDQEWYESMMKFMTTPLRWYDPLPQRLRRNNGPGESWKHVFLTHAKMYYIGDKYDNRKLRDVARSKMHHALKFWVIYREDDEPDGTPTSNVGDLVELIHYIYHNTVQRDKMREMLYFYVSCMARELLKYPEFTNFLYTVPECATRLAVSIIDTSKSGFNNKSMRK